MQYVLHTDGSCLGNPGPGGVGVVMLLDGKMVDSHGEYLKYTTNNEAELLAAIVGINMGVNAGATEIVLYSDSKYVINGATSWMHNWKAKDWTKKGGPIKNLELWMIIYDLNEKHKITWVWEKGHANSMYNTMADGLANGAATRGY